MLVLYCYLYCFDVIRSEPCTILEWRIVTHRIMYLIRTNESIFWLDCASRGFPTWRSVRLVYQRGGWQSQSTRWGWYYTIDEIFLATRYDSGVDVRCSSISRINYICVLRFNNNVFFWILSRTDRSSHHPPSPCFVPWFRGCVEQNTKIGLLP